MRQFSEDLGELRGKLAQMGRLVEANLRQSIHCLTDADREAVSQVRRDEGAINEMQMEIDRMATRLLVLRQPVARDLRFLTAALKINTHLERIGDLAVNIAKRSHALREEPPLASPIDIPRMASLAELMLSKSLEAWTKEDAAIAQEVLPLDTEVNAFRDAAHDAMVAAMQKDSVAVPAGMLLIFLTRHLERVADHAASIAKEVILMITGIDIRHHRLDDRG